MALIEFKNLPDTSTPATAENLNNNFNELNNAIIEEVVLYDNEDGSNANITLSDSAANYKYLEIFFAAESSYSSLRVYKPNYKNFVTQIIVIPVNSQNYYKISKWYISDTSILLEFGTNYFISSSLAITDWVASSQIYITRVVGYK